MNRIRIFNDVTITFKTEQDAKDFDSYLESETIIYYAGKEIGRSKVKDNFDVYKFFNIKK